MLMPFSGTFSTGQVIQAAKIPNDTLQNWIKRGVIIGRNGEEIDKPGQPGVRRSFSFESVMQIAIAKRLSDLGVRLELANRVSASFAHTGDHTRRPCQIFPLPAQTLLIVGGKRPEIVVNTIDDFKIVEWKSSEDSRQIILEILVHAEESAAAVLNLTKVFREVRDALGL